MFNILSWKYKEKAKKYSTSNTTQWPNDETDIFKVGLLIDAQLSFFTFLYNIVK